MAVLSAGGCWLPRGLTFGPTNGPEDFQELVFTLFQRRLYKDWFLFVDDLSIATGRKKCHGESPSGAHDVSCQIRAETEGERSKGGLNNKSGKSFPSPTAHLVGMWKKCRHFFSLTDHLRKIPLNYPTGESAYHTQSQEPLKPILPACLPLSHRARKERERDGCRGFFL